MKTKCPPILLGEDTAYIMGLLYGKGKIEEKEDQCRLRFEIRYKLPEIEGVDVAYAIIRDFLKLQRVIETELSLRMNVGELPEPGIRFRRPITMISDWTAANSLLLRRLFHTEILTGRALSKVPPYIFDHPVNTVKSFLQGIADSTALPPSPKISEGTAAFKESGASRIQLELEFGRWFVAVQVCRMFQEKMKAKVFGINWGHPNIRGKETWSGQNHQLRLYMNEFAKVGFRMRFKRSFFEATLKQLKSRKSRQKDYCPRKCVPAKKTPFRCTRHNEGDKEIPTKIRGLHFDTFWQVCEALGCNCRETCRDEVPLKSFKSKIRKRRTRQ